MLSPHPGPAPSPARPAPPPALLPGDVERQLTARQREVLDALEALAVEGGIVGLTMAQLARGANCSLRTLYGLAPRKDELLLIVIDRRLHRIARAALRAMERKSDPVDALRAFLELANESPGRHHDARQGDLALLPGTAELIEAHDRWVIAVTEFLLERAVQEGRVQPVDVAALARVLGGLASFCAQPSVFPRLQASPKQAANAIMEIILRGLAGPVAPD